jgi:hypothetical protein
MYRIREVDGHDDDIADTIADLHRLTFFDGASIPKFDEGHWWLTFFDALPVACRPRSVYACQMPGIFRASASCKNTVATAFNCA